MRKAGTLLLVAILTLPPAEGALAHPAEDHWLFGEWQVTEVDPCWGDDALIGSTTAKQNRRARIKDGHAVWNAEPPSIYFDFDGCEDTSLYARSPCNNFYPGTTTPVEGGLFYRAVDGIEGGTLAETRRCDERHGLNKIRQYTIIFDQLEPWYLGTSTPTPSGQRDMFGVATHEAGHALGGWSLWAHFNAASLCGGGTLCCPGNTTNHTMCDTVPGNYGGAYLRSLETHDKDTFDDAY